MVSENRSVTTPGGVPRTEPGGGLAEMSSACAEAARAGTRSAEIVMAPQRAGRTQARISFIRPGALEPARLSPLPRMRCSRGLAEPTERLALLPADRSRRRLGCGQPVRWAAPWS